MSSNPDSLSPQIFLFDSLWSVCCVIVQVSVNTPRAIMQFESLATLVLKWLWRVQKMKMSAIHGLSCCGWLVES